MDMEYGSYYLNPMFDEVWNMHDSSIQNQTELTAIRKKEHERMEAKRTAIRDIELEMALGGDKAKLEMLANVVIE